MLVLLGFQIKDVLVLLCELLYKLLYTCIVAEEPLDTGR